MTQSKGGDKKIEGFYVHANATESKAQISSVFPEMQKVLQSMAAGEIWNDIRSFLGRSKPPVYFCNNQAANGHFILVDEGFNDIGNRLRASKEFNPRRSIDQNKRAHG